MKIRGILLSLLFVILITSVISADIIITQQPENTYSLGDIINLPVKITTLTSLNDFFTLTILCSGQESQVHKEFVSLLPGEEKQINSQIPLILSFTGKSTASCSLKALMGEQYTLTDTFEVSDSIEIAIKEGETEFNPGESIVIEGDVKKSNGKFVDGFIDLTLQAEGIESIAISDTVKNGYFFANFSLPENTKAAKYSIAINIYEKDFQGQITNQGSASQMITIKQVPTNLELILENPDVEPGTSLILRTILHDQTGEPIKATSTIKIEDDEGKLLTQVDQATEENYEFPIVYNQAPDTWFISATSGILETEAEFNIIPKETVKVEIVNKTVVVTNMGNVAYNKSILVKIGKTPFSIETNLEVDQVKKYVLEAPDGEYDVSVATNEGNLVEGSVFLTGKEIDVRAAGLRVGRFFANPIVWIFLILVLICVFFIIFRKGLKRALLGYKPKFLDKDQKTDESKSVIFEKRQGSLINSRNPAQLSLSIKGEKQESAVVALAIKNMGDLKNSNANEPLQKIVDLAEEHKAATYENQEHIFFILAPAKTRTFHNDKVAVNLANYAQEILTQHNKLARQKIDFGVAVNYGVVVAKHEGPILKFMSMGTLITSSKKISSIAKGEVLLSRVAKEKLMSYIKADKEMRGNLEVFKIKEIKSENPEDKKFIHQFVERYEKENRERVKR